MVTVGNTIPQTLKRRMSLMFGYHEHPFHLVNTMAADNMACFVLIELFRRIPASAPDELTFIIF